MAYLTVISALMQHVFQGRERPNFEKTKLNGTLHAITWMIYCMPAIGSPDNKPHDPEYVAYRAQVSSALEAFSEFLSAPLDIGLHPGVSTVFTILGFHGYQAGLLSPLILGAMRGYLDKYRKAHGELSWELKRDEEWIRSLYRKLRLNHSEQVHHVLTPLIWITSNFEPYPHLETP